MNKITIFCLGILLALVSFSFKKDEGAVSLKEVNVQTPFDMPAIQIPDFSKCKKIIITEFGAVPGDKVKNMEAIANAIDKANKLGGGIVVIPAGEWKTGQIHLKSNVNLYLSKGALLVFSDDPNDYLPAVHSSWEGLECYNYSPLIYAYQCKNVAITGEGGIKATMGIWQKW